MTLGISNLTNAVMFHTNMLSPSLECSDDGSNKFCINLPDCTMSHPRRQYSYLHSHHHEKNLTLQKQWKSRWHIKFRRQGITQKKAHNIHNMAKVWNQEKFTVAIVLSCRHGRIEKCEALGRLLISNTLKLVFIKLFGPRTGMVNLFESVWIIFREILPRMATWAY
jgi:hypothetical protein